MSTPSTADGQGLGVGRLLRDRADLRPDAPFVVTAGESGDPVTLTYADLADISSRPMHELVLRTP